MATSSTPIAFPTTPNIGTTRTTSAASTVNAVLASIANRDLRTDAAAMKQGCERVATLLQVPRSEIELYEKLLAKQI